tara:strand:+ start:33 stop:236 length:204 start_codon:yes stop_codon:yes gene_type:complete
MITKIVVGFFMMGILFALVLAGRGVIKGKGSNISTLLSLKWRIGLSVFLFMCLFIAFSCGLIQPHGL